MELNGTEAPRAFALAAQSKRLPAALFALRHRKAAAAREFLVKANLGALIFWLGWREAKASIAPEPQLKKAP